MIVPPCPTSVSWGVTRKNCCVDFGFAASAEDKKQPATTKKEDRGLAFGFQISRDGLYRQPASSDSQPVKIDFNKKLDLKQKTIQTFNIDAQRFRKTKKENPLSQEIGVAS